jgi:TPR repeat protein
MATVPTDSSRSSIPRASLLEWYEIRDKFFGRNCVYRNIPLALEMATSCQHPDALWLTNSCAGKDVKTFEDAKRVFSALGQNDARALCFMWLCGAQEELAPLRRSAEIGFAFAQALMAGETRGEEAFKFFQLAALQGERDGFYGLGVFFRGGFGCEKDLIKAQENLVLASELGHVSAMGAIGQLSDESDSQRWRWWGRAAALGFQFYFLSGFAKQVEMFKVGSGSAVAVYAIGRVLQGQVNEKSNMILGESYNFESRIGPAKVAIAFYQFQIKATKDAMRAWTQVGMRWKVVKDVRKLISKLIWDSREQGLYKK